MSPTSWVMPDDPELPRYRLPRDGSLRLLDRFTNPAISRTHPQYEFWYGRYGHGSWRQEPWLSWNRDDRSAPDSPTWSRPEVEPSSGKFILGTPSPAALPAPGAVALLPGWALFQTPAPRIDLLGSNVELVCKAYERMLPVTLGRHGSEQDTFVLLECDGSVSSNALDRLSVIARPPGVDRPELPLPLEPLQGAEHGEWVPGVRMLHPRTVWLVQKIALAFPGRPIYVVSGYRPDGHTSLHRRGRALDLFVMGIENEELFRYCRKLRDVGCGYYPHHPFVHMDVRGFGAGHPLWVDISGPGQTSRYVDSWPGVVEGGALSWGADP